MDWVQYRQWIFEETMFIKLLLVYKPQGLQVPTMNII